MKVSKKLRKHQTEIIAAFLTILATGFMMFGTVHGFMSEHLTDKRAFVGGIAIGVAFVQYYVAMRIMRFGE